MAPFAGSARVTRSILQDDLILRFGPIWGPTEETGLRAFIAAETPSRRPANDSRPKAG